jgi:hypothetical protein
MTDPRNAGLSDLGQRMQAMSDPAPDPQVGPHLAPRPEIRPEPRFDPRQRNPWDQYHGAPLPIGPAATGSRPLPTPPAPPAQIAAPEPSPAQSLVAPQPAQPQPTLPAPDDSAALASGLLRSALPFFQKLLDGGFANMFGSLTTQQPQHSAPPAVRVDLAPVERGLAEVSASNRELRNLVQEQAVALKRAEDQLERVREATDRNTLEQQELVEDIRSTGNRVSNLAVIGLVLLVVLLGLNIYFLVQFQHILR